MIHILDKVYISYAETSVGPYSMSRLPESYVRIIDKGLSDMFEAGYNKYEIAYGKTLDEVLSKFQNEEQFFNAVMGEISSGKAPKVIMYMDENAMLEFLIRWWKFLFPNLTPEGGYAIYKMFADSETLRPAKNKETFLDITVKSDKVTFEKFGSDYWSVSKQLFLDKYSVYPAFNLPSWMRTKCSLEFLIMDYLLNPNEMKPELMYKIQKMYTRQFSNQLWTMVRTLQHKMYYLATECEGLNTAAILDGKSIKETLLRDSRYKILFDFNIQDSSKLLEYVESNYELHKVCKDLMSLEFMITGKQGFSERVILDMDPLVGYYSETGQHPRLVDIVNEEIVSLGKYKLFNTLINNNRFNPFLIISFKNLIQTKGKEDPFVKQFSLT